MPDVRPVPHAGIELGVETVWPAIDRAMRLGIDDWTRIARRIVPAAAERDLHQLGRAVRRVMFGCMLDKTVTTEEIRASLRSLIVGEPIGSRVGMRRIA